MFEGKPETFGEEVGSTTEGNVESEERSTLLEKKESLFKRFPNPSPKVKRYLMSCLALIALSTEQAQAAQTNEYVPSSGGEITVEMSENENMGNVESQFTTPLITIEEARENITDEEFLQVSERETESVTEFAFGETEGEENDPVLFEHKEATISLNNGYSFKTTHEGDLPEASESVRLETSSYMSDVSKSSENNDIEDQINDFSGFADVMTVEKAEMPGKYESVGLTSVGASYTSREDAILHALRSAAESIGVFVDSSDKLSEQDSSDGSHEGTFKTTISTSAEAYIVSYEVIENSSSEQRSDVEKGLHSVQLKIEFAIPEQPAH